MAIIDIILKAVNNAQIAGAAIYPTGPYKGSLPKGTVKKGTRNSDAKAVQTFLNWCIKAGLKVDGYCGKNTAAAIKRFQKQYKIKVDGVFGSQSRAKARTIIQKYAPPPTPAPTPTPTPTPTPAPTPMPTPTPAPAQTWLDKANAYANKIAADNSYHYVKWTSNTKTHECPICHNHPVGAYHGWNCIGFAFSIWRHGAGLGNRCSCGVISNAVYEQILKASYATALATTKKKVGINNITLIRNKNGIPKSQWKAGDICIKFSGNKYIHTFYYMGGGKIADSTSAKSTASQIAVRDYKNYTCKLIIRYTGK